MPNGYRAARDRRVRVKVVAADQAVRIRNERRLRAGVGVPPRGLRPEAGSEHGIGLLSSRTAAKYSSRPSPARSSGPAGPARVARAQVRRDAERATVMSR